MSAFTAAELEVLGVEAHVAEQLAGVSFRDLHAAAAKSEALSILDLMEEIPWFHDASWDSWRAFLKVVFGLPLSPSEFSLYRECTGRKDRPQEPFREVYMPVGRRGGKSRVVSLTGTYLATCRDYSPYLQPGERGMLPVIARDKDEAQTILGYLKATFALPGYASLVASTNASEIHLTNRITIKVFAASFRAVRGYTVVGALLDEVAFWMNENSANPDTEILKALRPAMATIPGSVMFCLSSPYAKRGVLWTAFKRHFGVDGSTVLVWKAPTLTMHPGNPVLEAEVEKAYRDDPLAASSEYGAEFRDDVETYVSEQVIEDAVIPGRRVIPPGRQNYFAFCDPSGGGADSFTLAIAHYDQGHEASDEQEARGPRIVLDRLDEWRSGPGKTLDPDVATREAAAVLQAYGLARVKGDKYAGEWPSSRFRAHGVIYDKTKQTKSQIYGDILPALNAGRVELLDIERLKAQLIDLDRKTARGGRDSIDHAQGGHDDLANAAAGALLLADTLGAKRPLPKVVPPKPTNIHELRAQQMQESIRKEMERQQGPGPGIPARRAVWRRARR